MLGGRHSREPADARLHLRQLEPDPRRPAVRDFGLLAVYLGAVFTAATIRSLGGAGSARASRSSAAMSPAGSITCVATTRNTINVTLNMIVDNQLKFDTLVADRRVWYVWPNACIAAR